MTPGALLNRLALLRATAFWRVVAPGRAFVARRHRLGSLVDSFEQAPLGTRLLALAVGSPQARYRTWIRAYDTVTDADLVALRRQPASTHLTLVVPASTMPGALERSLAGQVHTRWDVQLGGDSRKAAPSAGEFAVLVDPRASLPPHALALIAREIDEHPDAVVVYADEDEIDGSGMRTGHDFKPDWNEALSSSQHYFGGLVAVRRSLALDHDEPIDEVLHRIAVAAPPGTVRHLPYVLSHRPPAGPRVARVSAYAQPSTRPLVSVIIPTRGEERLLRPCLEGVLDRTDYPNVEVLVAVHESRKHLVTEPRVRVLPYERPFSFSWVNNWAVEQARGELVCFLNDDTEPIEADWLSAMVARVSAGRVGAVGAKLLFPSGRIQHAGVILGVGGVAGHNYAGKPRDFPGYHGRALLDQDVSCVTAACMLVRREAFQSVGGFDERLGVAFNDVDLCLRLREAGWRIVWTPHAELYHRESSSLGRHDSRPRAWAAERELIRSRWGNALLADPYYSPNLSLDRLQLWEPAFPPRVTTWRASPDARRGEQ